MDVGLTAQTLSCAAKAHVPKSRGTAVAASAADAAMIDCNCRDADFLVGWPSRFSGGPKPGRIRFSV